MLFNLPMRIGGGRGDAGDHVLDQLSAYIDYELADAERERVRDHLRRCPACENELATLKATKQLMSEVPLRLAPRSFILTPDMVGRGLTGPVERRRTVGWTLAGRLRTASALVAVLLVLVLSGDVLSRIESTGSRAATGAAPPALGATASDTSVQRLAAPTTQALAAATSTPLPPAALGATGAGEPPAPAAPGPADTSVSATEAAPETPTTAAAAAPPVATESSPTDGLTTNSQSYDWQLALTPVAKGVTAEAAPPVSGWQLAEGALLILLLVLGVGALWARGRGV